MDDAWSEFKVWYNSKPLVTRSYLAGCVGVTLLVTLGLLNPMTLLYSPRATFFELNLWRPFTALFFMGKFSFGFLFNIYFAYIALLKVETVVFTRDKFVDFLWLNVLLWLGCILAGTLITMSFFSRPYLMAMIYIWCKKFPNEEITFMFGFRVKSTPLPHSAGYFPFVYALCMMLFGDSLVPYLVGIGLGHLYIFVKDIATLRYNRDYLPTPRWFYNWWHRGAQAVPGDAPRRPAGFFQGAGVRLG